MSRLTPGQIADTICQTLTLPEVVQFYGIQVSMRGNFICCPFHGEKTPSCKISDKLFHCFGCGASGNLIQFVEKLFDADFKSALVRIDNDFNLGLTGQTVSEEQRRKAEAIRQKRAEEEKIRTAHERYIKGLEEEYLKIWKMLLFYDPTDLDHVDERWLWAINNFDYYDYLAQAYGFNIERFDAELLFIEKRELTLENKKQNVLNEVANNLIKILESIDKTKPLKLEAVEADSEKLNIYKEILKDYKSNLVF